MTNDPTTGEIVRVLRGCAEKTLNCEECPYNTGSDIQCLDNVQRKSADRLESQEREIEQLNRTNDGMIDMMGQMTDRINELTARAESAERERDAAVELYVPQRCSTCAHSTGTACAAQGNGCKWKYRGLQPQDGGEK